MKVCKTCGLPDQGNVPMGTVIALCQCRWNLPNQNTEARIAELEALRKQLAAIMGAFTDEEIDSLIDSDGDNGASHAFAHAIHRAILARIENVKTKAIAKAKGE